MYFMVTFSITTHVDSSEKERRNGEEKLTSLSIGKYINRIFTSIFGPKIDKFVTFIQFLVKKGMGYFQKADVRFYKMERREMQENSEKPEAYQQ